jgi:hypothetical protein
MMLACAVATLAGARAQAIELYASAPPGAGWTAPFAPPPPRLVLTQPMQARVLVHTPALVQPLQTHVQVHVSPPDSHPPSATHPQRDERRDAAASFFVGGGYGGMTGFQGGAASTWRLHVGVGLGATEIGLRADIANRALGELANTPGGVWMVSAEVAHRFLPGATVRPVLGASFDRWQIEPDGRQGAGAFGLGARGGVEVHYRLDTSVALVLGADLGYHRLLASVDNAPVVNDVLTFGATADLRL